jgi:hypothetical protein
MRPGLADEYGEPVYVGPDVKASSFAYDLRPER